MATSLLHSSEETYYCDACQAINKVTSVAVYSCEECQHELCTTCAEHHRNTLSTRNHKVTQLQAIKESEFQVSGRRQQAIKESEFQVSGRRQQAIKESEFQVSGRRQQDIKESEFQVSGRRSNEESARRNKEMGSKQSVSITQGVQGMSISPGPSTKSIANTSDKVYTTAALKKGLNLSLESDDGLCEVWGIVLLQDRIIVSDKNNSKLKVFDNSSIFQFDYKCDTKPYDIDMLDNTTIVVCAWSHKVLKVMSVGSYSMEVLVNINTEYGCCGVCCHGGNIYCVVSEEIQSEWYSEVRIYSPDGTFKRKFDYLSDGKVVCNDLRYITVNPRTGTLYVTDWEKGVVALSSSGDVIAVMSSPQLKNPQGITVDDHGQIYVCGLNSNNVIQMSADENRVVEILSKTPKCKGAQSVKIYGNRMFFSRRDNGAVYIYELS